MEYLSQSAAGHVVDPQRPLSPDTLRVWHDKVHGPKDTAGRRIWTAELCMQIRDARTAAQKVRRTA